MVVGRAMLTLVVSKNIISSGFITIGRVCVIVLCQTEQVMAVRTTAGTWHGQLDLPVVTLSPFFVSGGGVVPS